MGLPELLAGVMLASLVLYASLGGADFGGGLWDLLASGPRARASVSKLPINSFTSRKVLYTLAKRT